MIPVLIQLEMGGGEKDAVWDANTLYIGYEATILYIFRGFYDLKTIYIDKDSDLKRIQADWTDWLDGSDISSVACAVQDSATIIAVSETSNTSKIATAYINATKYNQELFLKCTITTNDSPAEIESRSFLIKTLRTF